MFARSGSTQNKPIRGCYIQLMAASLKYIFKNRAYETETMLSRYIWQLKDKGLTYNIKWKILKYSKAYSPITQTCRLCFDEQMLILKHSSDPAFLNKRDELFSKCRHRLKHLLCKVK